jgi:hypothetical protein
MSCTDARDALLVAEPSELRGGGDSPLAAHLESCIACRAMAARLSRDLGRLRSAVVQASNVRRRRRRAALMVGVPIAASLVATVVVVARHAPARDTQLVAVSSPVVSVDVARGQQAAVFNTNDPSVTVVWLSPGGDP